MENTQYSTSIGEIRSVILSWLKSHLSNDQYIWLAKTGEDLKNSPEDWELFISFSSASRHTGKKKVELTSEQIKIADSLRKGWNPSKWTVDQLARTFLILCYSENGKDQFFKKIDKIFNTSDLSESVALYQSLPVFPFPEDLKYRAAEGVRSNITSVFNAVALENPYPKDYLPEDPWNQIILKAIFVGSPLYKIMGLDERANKKLASILVEYAHERISAGRVVSPELWRLVGPYIDDEIVSDIKWLMNQQDELQKKAGVLAIMASDFKGKDELLHKYQSTIKMVLKNNISWDDIGVQFHFNKK